MKDPENSPIQDRITTLEENIANMRQRLDPLMGLTPVPISTQGSTPPSTRSHIRGRLEALIEEVQDISARLEI